MDYIEVVGRVDPKHQLRFGMNDDSGERVLCINADGYPASLTVDKSYCTLSDYAALQHGMIRVVDDSGEDYLYPASLVEPVQLTDGTERQTFRNYLKTIYFRHNGRDNG